MRYGNELLLNYTVSGGSPTVTLQSRGGLSLGVHKQRNKQTRSMCQNTNPLNRPGTQVITQVVARYKNTKENILDYQWFSIRHIL